MRLAKLAKPLHEQANTVWKNSKHLANCFLAGLFQPKMPEGTFGQADNLVHHPTISIVGNRSSSWACKPHNIFRNVSDIASKLS